MITFVHEETGEVFYRVPVATDPKIRYSVFLGEELIGSTAGSRKESILIDTPRDGHFFFKLQDLEKMLKKEMVSKAHFFSAGRKL
jgi:hypothetical protein